ncbi:MAG: glycosyltransferase family 4 protein [Cyclobacteriaceae bacterium]
MKVANLALVCSEYPPGPGGIGNQAYNLALFFHDQGWKLSVFAPSRPEFDSAAFDNSSPWPITRYSADQSSWTKLRLALRFFGHQPRGSWIVLSGAMHLKLALIVRLFFSHKVLSILHGSEFGPVHSRSQRTLRLALKYAYARVAVSDFTRRLAQKQTGLKRAIEVIPNGINLSTIPRVEHLPRQIDGFSQPLKLVTVGSITERKGQENVVRALPSIKKHFPHVVYHVIGMDKQRALLDKAAGDLLVSDQVVIHGPVSDDEKWKLLRDSSVFMMLSNHLPNGDVEGFGIAVLEANAMGIPAIGSRGTGIEQAIVDGVTGRLVDVRDPEAILQAVEDVLNGYQDYSRQALLWAEKHDWANIGNRYLRVLESA